MITCVSSAAFCTLFVCAASGSQFAFDSAADSAYNNGWTQGSNGGFGWASGWSLDLVHGFPLIGSSATNGFGDPDGDGDINSPRSATGRAWGAGFEDVATRQFNGPLSVGQTFSVDFDDYGGSSNANFFSTVSLLARDGTTAVALRANVGSDYRIDPNMDTGVRETDQGIHVAFTQLAGDVQVSITPYITGAPTSTVVFPYTGQVEGFQFRASSAANPTPAFETPYVNNISITPEPGGAGLIVLGSCFALLGRRRQVLGG